jgi:hypothetical protein
MKIDHIRQSWIFSLLLVPLFISYCHAQPGKSVGQTVISGIQTSYVDANVPEDDKFDRFLKRDLNNYFRGTVTTELLRQGATQSGVAYPKFYVWVKIYKYKKLADEGAVRVEAVEKKSFRVTNFVSIEQIKKNTKDIYTIFPVLVCEKIKTHL